MVLVKDIENAQRAEKIESLREGWPEKRAKLDEIFSADNLKKMKSAVRAVDNIIESKRPPSSDYEKRRQYYQQYYVKNASVKSIQRKDKREEIRQLRDEENKKDEEELPKGPWDQFQNQMKTG